MKDWIRSTYRDLAKYRYLYFYDTSGCLIILYNKSNYKIRVNVPKFSDPILDYVVKKDNGIWT